MTRAALYVYLSIFSLLIMAGLGFPIPEELPIITSGIMVGHASDSKVVPEATGEVVACLAFAPDAEFPANVPWAGFDLTTRRDMPLPLRWWIMLPLCILGVVIGDVFLYGMGRLGGPRLLEMGWAKRILPRERKARIEENFHKYGILVLLFARFLPTIRSPIFIMAGVTRVPFLLFLLADGLYAIPGVSLLFFLSFWFGDQFRDLFLAAEGKAKSLIILLTIAGVGGYLIYHFLRHPVATGDPRVEIPVIGGKVADHINSSADIAGFHDAQPTPAPRESNRSPTSGGTS